MLRLHHNCLDLSWNLKVLSGWTGYFFFALSTTGDISDFKRPWIKRIQVTTVLKLKKPKNKKTPRFLLTLVPNLFFFSSDQNLLHQHVINLYIWTTISLFFFAPKKRNRIQRSERREKGQDQKKNRYPSFVRLYLARVHLKYY